jgi:beta-phosphoglucomutase-like phosphatase (HAD superfamily)
VEDGVSGIEAAIAAGMTVFALSGHDRWKLDQVVVIRVWTRFAATR